MLLQSLGLRNFRNYENFRIKFDPLTILVGPNGSGKTNLLEAIFILNFAHSWRTCHKEELINWQKNFCSLKGQTKDQNIEIIFNQDKKPYKIIKISGVKKRDIDLLGKLPLVLFIPENLGIISGSPRDRRRFLDLILIQTDKEYTRNLILLQKTLKSRNNLLSGINLKKNKMEELFFWDQKLIDLSIPIITARRNLVNFINNFLKQYYPHISGQKRSFLELKYCSIIPNKEKFLEMISLHREKEISSAATLYGPHRDDLEFFLNHKKAKLFASRGEIRSIILALKRAELEFISKKIKEEPLFLLDDIFSEIDKERRSSLLPLFNTRQAILTTTNLEELPSKLKNKSRVINLNSYFKI